MRTLLMTIGVVLVASWCLAWGQEQTPRPGAPSDAENPQTQAEPSPNFWMSTKLRESQDIFAALAQADFSAIEKSTTGLQGLTKLEAFVRRRSPEYRTQLRSFEFAVQEMNKHAQAENLEGVVLGFHQMTLSCVNCHKQLRTLPLEDNETTTGYPKE